jgi:hypothetical protein
MDITGNDSLKYARDGRIVVSFSPCTPEKRYGDDPHALDHLIGGLRFGISGPKVDDDPVEPDECISSALALIGRITGADIADDWLRPRHSCIRRIPGG